MAGLVAGKPIVISKPAAAPAPAAPEPSAAPSPYSPWGGGGSSYQPASGGSSYPAYSGGGGGGGGGSFSFNMPSNAAAAPAPMPGMDFSSLISGVGDLLKQGQASDIPEEVAAPVQKNTMELQALREGSAGWGGNISGPGVNPALGNRIPPDESKKLAALNAARIY